MRISGLNRSLLARLAAFVIIGAGFPPVIHGDSFALTDGFIGEIQRYKVGKKESLLEIARRFDLGYNEIVDANPGVDPFLPKPGTIVTIPTAWIPPKSSVRPLIVINIPELRLYYFAQEDLKTVVTFPLGIGDEGNDTPVGSYTVIEKILNPAWYVPKSIRDETRGLPIVVPPGPKNPMGSHALRLSRQDILIHGTNRPWGIGRRSSHGCLRLYPEDIVRFFKVVPKGTQVQIVSQPVKIGTRGNRVFVEVHRYDGEEPSVGQTLHMLANAKLVGVVDFSKVIQAIEEKNGLPFEITFVQ